MLAALVLAGCAPRPPLEEPAIKSVPAALIADSGASLYVLEGWDDWPDDCDMLLNSVPVGGYDIGGVGFTDIDEKADPQSDPAPSSNVKWMGEQALKLVLRHGLSQKRVSLLAHADFQPGAGLPVEVTLYKPESEGGPGGESMRKAFRLRMKATAKGQSYADLSWEAELLTDRPSSADSCGRPGHFARVSERIDGGSTTLPFGGTLFMHHPIGGHRSYILLLRIASLKDP